MLLLATSHVREPARWRAAFVLAACSVGLWFISGCCLLPMVPEAAFVFLATLYFPAPLAVVAAAVRDMHLGARYDALHWVGVIAAPALALVLFVLITVFLLSAVH
jgi:hypothetical protein